MYLQALLYYLVRNFREIFNEVISCAPHTYDSGELESEHRNSLLVDRARCSVRAIMGSLIMSFRANMIRHTAGMSLMRNLLFIFTAMPNTTQRNVTVRTTELRLMCNPGTDFTSDCCQAALLGSATWATWYGYRQASATVAWLRASYNSLEVVPTITLVLYPHLNE